MAEVNQHDIKNFSKAARNVLSRAAATGEPLSEKETQIVADEVRKSREFRPMFGSFDLERELLKIKNKK